MTQTPRKQTDKIHGHIKWFAIYLGERKIIFMNDPKNVEKLQRALDEERDLILKKITELEKPTSFGDDVDGFDEKTDESEEYANQVGESQILKERLEEIEIAMSKIKNGEYGKCENCREQIPTENLESDPALKNCPICQK